MGLNYFTYNGTSSASFNIRVTAYPDYDIPRREVERVSVPGRSGDLLMDTGAYSNFDKTYEIYFNARGSGFHTSAHDVAMWLCNVGGYARLEDTYDTDVYLMARVENPETLANWMNYMGRATVVFNCKPQRWLKSGETESAITSGVDIVNDYMPCYPIFKITGNGTFTVNGNSVAVANNLNKTLVLDCETQNAYTGTQNRNGDIYITGEFPYLESGTNEVTFNNASVTMIPRWWTL